ncbi:unnamed protein product [Cyprideis torosa]|uniref:Uncharacterized protein n=1 Tax=Cyprideis torosa TaxID=163714 RepID=A0A7R8W4E6_9CRUS|nr:unnamed protein product [Cyprideis torosa]CAG0884093.1 unnamed protein product [Cyprideis torosa]
MERIWHRCLVLGMLILGQATLTPGKGKGRGRNRGNPEHLTLSFATPVLKASLRDLVTEMELSTMPIAMAIIDFFRVALFALFSRGSLAYSR